MHIISDSDCNTSNFFSQNTITVELQLSEHDGTKGARVTEMFG